MVAYSFAPQFRAAVSTLAKRQTVRAPRRRHAIPGEPVQLYTAMRTKYCRKLVDPDPICTAVREIGIRVTYRMPFIQSIEIEGVALTETEMEAFAQTDGFGPWCGAHSAREQMGFFWLQAHGAGLFEGVLIEWEPPHAG